MSHTFKKTYPCPSILALSATLSLILHRTLQKLTSSEHAQVHLIALLLSSLQPRQRETISPLPLFLSVETRSESRFNTAANRLQLLTSSYWRFRDDRRTLYHKWQLTTVAVCGLFRCPKAHPHESLCLASV